ncbi:MULTISPECIES: hypothetical protein [Trichocoleus]|uniref:Uncharacterized protein n=1 Tax=Trichocoleus desertorum GB2-A4 TaxID=2933944 RepID=A0ABV0JG97_9CYAN|nr:hypothetical protein [Trichocoleus sp. FACHB-46]MBD1865130.1 hypothetical protein [Trichocoleus sp. FACHB-46]
MPRSPIGVSLGLRLFCTTLALIPAIPAAAQAAVPVSPTNSLHQTVLNQANNTQRWLLAGKDDKDDKKDHKNDKKGRDKERKRDDDRKENRKRDRVESEYYERTTEIRVQESQGWRSYVNVARLANSSSLVLQLNVLQKPVTRYANVVYIVYARQNNQWVQAYTSTGARLVANQAGQITLNPEVIRLDQLKLSTNVDYSQLQLRVETQIRYDVRDGQRDQRVVFEQPCNYATLTQINRVEQISTTNTINTSTTTGSTTQTSGRQSITLSNGYRVTFLGVNYTSSSSIWRYYVEELPVAQDLSNWVLGLPPCARVLNSSLKGELVNPDPNAKISGIKWQPGGGFERGEFSVTLNGRWAVGTTTVAVKGPDVARGQLPGPSCSSI